MSRTIGMALASALVLAQSVQADDALDIHSGPQCRLIWETSPADEDEKREAPAGHVVEDATDCFSIRTVLRRLTW